MVFVLVLGASSHSKTHSIATEVYRTARERIGLFHLAARGASGGFSARLTTEPDTRFHEALGKGRGGPASAKPILVNSTPEE